jgi:Cu2+-exporting ATPase
LREPFDTVEEEPGEGVRTQLQGLDLRLGSAAFCEAQGAAEEAMARHPDGSLICLRHGDQTAVFVIEQALRPDAVACVQAMTALGLECRLLSGDRAASVEPVAQALGISNWRAGTKPADKIAALEALKAQGKRVLMVGDGINDAPALAAAHVAISPITGSDLAQAASDAVFMGEKLMPVLKAIEIARHARALMRQNLGLAIVYNALAVPLAVAGFVTPLIAAAAMSGSSILVTLNALRASRLKEAKL